MYSKKDKLIDKLALKKYNIITKWNIMGYVEMTEQIAYKKVFHNIQ